MRTMICTAGWWTPSTRKRVATHLLPDISFCGLIAYTHVFTYGSMFAESDESRVAGLLLCSGERSTGALYETSQNAVATDPDLIAMAEISRTRVK